MDYSPSNTDYLQERLNRAKNAQRLEGSDCDFFAWKSVLAASGETVFANRLVSLNLDETQARQRTRRANENREPPVPQWFAFLQEAFDSRDELPIDIDLPFAFI